MNLKHNGEKVTSPYHQKEILQKDTKQNKTWTGPIQRKCDFFLFLKLKINLRRQVTVLGVHDVPLHTWFVVWFPSFNTWPDIHEDTQEVEFWKQLFWSVALYKSWTRSSLSQACTGGHKTGKIENRPENECHLIVLYRLILSKLWRIIIGSWKKWPKW